MKLNELILNQRIVVQMVWGDKKIEFYSEVEEINEEKVLISPYMHQGKPLELNVETSSGVVCNIFANNPVTFSRVSWKNVEVKTIEKDGETYYAINTTGFNDISLRDDRRKHERITIRKKGFVYDGKKEDGIEVIVHDISDIGVSFYVQSNLAPKNSILKMTFEDEIGDKEFKINLECSVNRTQAKPGTVLYGCKIVGENRDYLVYGFMKRLERKNRSNQFAKGPSAAKESDAVGEADGSDDKEK